MLSKTFFSWSGGKDSALALHIARQQGVAVEALVTSINASTNRISMHGVRRELLQQQASAIRLPLHVIELNEMPGMKAYESAIHASNQQLVQQGFTRVVFGDIFLEDLRRYREELMAADGLACLFPLWQMNSREVMRRFIDGGFKAVVVCVNSGRLPQTFCGRLLNEEFLNDLPADVDPCGENGEYHSFVFDGPIFSSPIPFELGEQVYREYPAPSANDCFDTPQPAAGFWYQDLLAG